MSTADPDATSDEPSLGEKIRRRRRALGATLQEVADASNLSVGFLSQVERELAVPSLSSLANISTALQTHLTEFLSVPKGSPHTRRDERTLYSLPSGALQYERLSADFPGSVLNSVVVHEPPGHRSEPIRHEGEELFFVLQGALTLEVEGEITVLNAGDSMHFASNRRHSSWNHTTEPTALLHVCTMDVFGDNPPDTDRRGNRAGHDTDPTLTPTGNKAGKEGQDS